MMHNYLHGEFYKFFKYKNFIFELILILLYSGLVNYLYYIDLNAVDLLYENFIDEFSLLYVFVTIYFSSSQITSEIYYGTLNKLNRKYFVICKLIINLFYIFFIIGLSIISSFLISVILVKAPKLSCFNILKQIIKFLPVILILNLIALLVSCYCKKANKTFALTIIVYYLFGYISNIIINKAFALGYYFIGLNWDFNKPLLINKTIAIFITILWIIMLIIIIFRKVICKLKD